MSLAAYCKCRIQFHHDDRSQPQRNYSERSLIELRQHEFPDHAIRAVDVEHGKQEIFNIPVREDNRYNFGRTAEDADDIRGANGSYQIWLERDNRDAFHTALQTCFEMLGIRLAPVETRVQPSRPVNPTVRGEEPSSRPRLIEQVAAQSDTNLQLTTTILQDLQSLSRCIGQGDERGASRIASQLASQNLRLQDKVSIRVPNEEAFTILVQLDGNEYGIEQSGAKIPIQVFQSTTVRELRAIFEVTHNYQPSSQYFFANGQLAQDDSTMADLQVGPNSLFVLFILTHAKIFQKTGPWSCHLCQHNNQSSQLRCSGCSALRTE